MQQYNYADEIIKDNNNPLPQNRYVRYYADETRLTNNRQLKPSIFTGYYNGVVSDTTINEQKEIAFREGLKNDSIKL